MKPTLDELRAKAEAAKAWMPDRRRFCPKASSAYMGGHGCGCPACLGAKRAAEDVATLVTEAMSYVTTIPINPLHDGDTRLTKAAAAEYESDGAARIESYFGAPGRVAAFAAAVREFCS
jgi:hypothetical protein